MPRQVDHDARRQKIAQAVFELVSERGLEGATLRAVADRGGVSMGAVQRCFSTKDQMMAFVQEHMHRRITERVQRRIADSPTPESAMTMLEQTLVGIVPVDAPGLDEARVWLAFAAHAAVDADLGAVQREQDAALKELIVLLIRAARESGDVRTEVDAEQEAKSLIAFTDGLNLALLFGRYTPGEALSALDRRIAGLRAS